jgi:chromosome segregation ATPase
MGRVSSVFPSNPLTFQQISPSFVTMPRKDTSEQGEEFLAERLDALQATNASKFGDINDTLLRLEDQILANDNHLFTTNAKIEASQARLDARIGDSHASLNERIEDSRASIENLGAEMKDLKAEMKGLKAEMKAEQATLSTKLDQVLSSLDNSARQHHRSRSRSSRSSSHSNHADDHVRLQQPRPLPHAHPQDDAP